MSNPNLLPCAVTIFPPPQGGVVVGNDLMVDVPFPIVVETQGGNCYFHGYDLSGALVWDIFVWHPALRCPLYKVRASLPAVEDASETLGAAVTYDDGYGFSLHVGPSVIQVNAAPGTEVTIDENGLRSAALTASQNKIGGQHVGYYFSHGAFGMGGSCPDSFPLVPLRP